MHMYWKSILLLVFTESDWCTCLLKVSGVPVYWKWLVYLFTERVWCTCLLKVSGVPVYWKCLVYLFTESDWCTCLLKVTGVPVYWKWLVYVLKFWYYFFTVYLVSLHCFSVFMCEWAGIFLRLYNVTCVLTVYWMLQCIMFIIIIVITQTVTINATHFSVFPYKDSTLKMLLNYDVCR
jgi:hypothetical protein